MFWRVKVIGLENVNVFSKDVYAWILIIRLKTESSCDWSSLCFSQDLWTAKENLIYNKLEYSDDGLRE